MASEIEAFRCYLSAGHAAMDEEYERCLPWAIALDAEDGWGVRLASYMVTAGVSYGSEHRPLRYVNRTSHPTNCGAVLTGAPAVAAPTQSRSGGGSGSSGSGGGGGGW